jgi:hypothetical protein
MFQPGNFSAHFHKHVNKIYYIYIIVIIFQIISIPFLYDSGVNFIKNLESRGLIKRNYDGLISQQKFMPFVPTIPGRDEVRYYVNPNKRNENSSYYYLKILESLPENSILVDDWYHGYSIIHHYFQGVEGIRPDVNVVHWFEIFGGTQAQRDSTFEYLKEICSQKKVYISGEEFPVSTLIKRVKESGSYILINENGLLRLVPRKSDSKSNENLSNMKST